MTWPASAAPLFDVAAYTRSLASLYVQTTELAVHRGAFRRLRKSLRGHDLAVNP